MSMEKNVKASSNERLGYGLEVVEADGQLHIKATGAEYVGQQHCIYLLGILELEKQGLVRKYRGIDALTKEVLNDKAHANPTSDA